MLLAVDPGTTHSAFVLLSGAQDMPMLEDFGIEPNGDLLGTIRRNARGIDALAIERARSYGMAVGAEVLETIHWGGRFHETALSMHPLLMVMRPDRKEVARNLCGTDRAKDANIRQAIIDRYGGSESIRKGGPLHGVSKDVWAALAVGLWAIDSREDG